MLKQYLIIIAAFMIAGAGLIFLPEKGQELLVTNSRPIQPTLPVQQKVQTQTFTSSDMRMEASTSLKIPFGKMANLFEDRKNSIPAISQGIGD